MIECEKHKDCFANINGRCSALGEHTKGDDCPFYKKRSAKMCVKKLRQDCEKYAKGLI